MSSSSIVTLSVPESTILARTSLPELLAYLFEVQQARAALNVLDEAIGRLLTERVTSEGDVTETSMRGEMMSPTARWVGVRLSDISSPVSPLSNAPCPHRRMDGICSLGAMSTCVAPDDDGTISHVTAVTTFGTDVRNEISPTVPHLVGRVDT
jgi:hypothetical protein